MKDEVRKYMSEMAKKSAAKLTPEQRKERARKAVNARWAKHKKKKKED